LPLIVTLPIRTICIFYCCYWKGRDRAIYAFPLCGVRRGKLRDLSCECDPCLSTLIFLLRFGLVLVSSCNLFRLLLVVCPWTVSFPLRRGPFRHSYSLGWCTQSSSGYHALSVRVVILFGELRVRWFLRLHSVVFSGNEVVTPFSIGKGFGFLFSSVWFEKRLVLWCVILLVGRSL
jgi:hypothetical protein